MLKNPRGVKLLLITLIILSLISIGLTIFHPKDSFEKNFNEAIARHFSSLKDPVPGKDGLDGRTPVKGVDYFDGLKGDKGDAGKDSVSTHIIETIIKQIPINGVDGKDGYTPMKGVDYNDGFTPVLRCNESKNRWEQKYIGFENWTVVKNENGEPAKCVPKLP